MDNKSKISNSKITTIEEVSNSNHWNNIAEPIYDSMQCTIKEFGQLKSMFKILSNDFEELNSKQSIDSGKFNSDISRVNEKLMKHFLILEKETKNEF
jgi:hypothetical protein